MDVVTYALLKKKLSLAVADIKNTTYTRDQLYTKDEVDDLLASQLGSIESNTESGWNSTPSLMSRENVVYVYLDHNSYEDEQGGTVYVPAMKVGDGTTYLIDLPFVESGFETDALYDHINNTEIHITQQERNSWNNKVRAYIDPDHEDTLVLSTD